MTTADKILKFIKENGKVRANDLWNKFDISRVMIHRHLIKLQNDGFVTKTGKPPIVFYSPKVQKNEPNQITQSIAKNYKPEKIFLFGSYARGEENSDSDLDFFIVKDTNKNYFDRISEARKFIKTDKDVDLIIYTPKEYSDALLNNTIFMRQILKYGKMVYENKNLQQS